ncbi:hypothetical protein OEZ85_013159 [Tetradesmus obliquus]|uniref:AB hydrolase-1 domain-containing protein n=1 Tax=Tetradesmus obliquus TaxID=3088 RepID=A0ABY8U4V5_TETOB|nr:hypothetical protein OEZ85_013159 [Tetradesmus obliquus]
MDASADGQRTPLWRLDSLADAARSKEWQAAAAAAQAAAEAQQRDGPEPDSSMKKKSSGLFNSFKAFVTDLLPFGLNSTVKGTRSNLQRLMTLQIAALPVELPAGEGYDTLEENPTGFETFDHCETIREESSAPAAAAAAAATAAAAAPGLTEANINLMAAANAALAEAAAHSSSSTTPAVSRRSSLVTFAVPSQRQHSASLDTSAFAAAVPPSLRTSSEDSLTLQALQVLPSRKHSSLMSSRSMRSTGLPRASTLKQMESSRAWEDLQDIQEKQQQQQDAEAGPADPMPKSQSRGNTAAETASNNSSGGRTQLLQQGSEQQRDGGGLSNSFVRALAALSVGSFGSAVTSRIASLLKTQPQGLPFSSSSKKTAHKTLSTDGWTLHLVHCTDTSLEPGQRKRHPILMCPGLASSGPGTFDLLPHVSLTDFLAAAGWDVWVIDIRGNGLADKSSRIDIEQDWNIDDYLVQDVPACIDYVLKHSPCQAGKLHWVGHSMGGMLGSGLCSQAGKWGKRLRSVTLLGSGCFGDGSWHVLLKKLVVPVTSFGFPAHITTQGLALLANTPVALSVFEALFYWPANVEASTRTVFEALFYWPANVEASTRKALLATAFNFIPAKLVGQFLDSHGSASGLSNSRGSFLYADPDVLGLCKVPALGVNGDWDLFCPAAGGARNVALFGGPTQHLTFGPGHGHQAHYGHFDVIVGRHAQREVWPHLQAFLEQHDSPASLQQLWDAQLLREGEE